VTETMMNYSNASELLDHLRSDGKIVFQAPIDVYKVANELGICFEDDYSLPPATIGTISFHGVTATVKINPFQNNYIPRRRFTLAHEIGHFCLHRAKSQNGFSDSMHTMSRTESYWNPIESEANNFAAQLLMPKPLVMEEGQQVIDDYTHYYNTDTISAGEFVELMADRFVVSSKAMEYRLRNIGIIK